MPQDKEQGWAWFDPLITDAQQSEKSEDIAGLFASCFSGINGEKCLNYLAQQTLSRALGPNVDDGVLRHLEGQRYMVSFIMGLVQQGQTPRT